MFICLSVMVNVQRKYNKEFPTVFHTYQCYLTGMPDQAKHPPCDPPTHAKRAPYSRAAHCTRARTVCGARAHAHTQTAVHARTLPRTVGTHFVD